MNNLLNDLLNELLSKTWEMESIVNRLNSMKETLQQGETKKLELEKYMKNKTHIEEFVFKIDQRLGYLGVTIRSFETLKKEISNYYEEN